MNLESLGALFRGSPFPMAPQTRNKGRRFVFPRTLNPRHVTVYDPLLRGPRWGLPMRRYTMRLTWPETDRSCDFVFCVNGKEAGRCYRTIAKRCQVIWCWTVYGRSISGMEDTLAEAQQRFKQAYETAE